MGVFKGKRRSGLKLTTRKRRSYQIVRPSLKSPSASPLPKKQRQTLFISTPVKTPRLFRAVLQIPELRSPNPNTSIKSTSSKRKLEVIFSPNASKFLPDDIFDDSMLSIRHLDDEDDQKDEVDVYEKGFTNNIFDDSILSIRPLDDEDDRTDEVASANDRYDDDVSSLVKILPSVLEELSNVGKKDVFMRFFPLVKAKKIPLNNIAFDLFLEVVKWYDQEDVRTVRYSPSTLQFFWLGKKLFGGRFIRFMSGHGNETDILRGKTSLSPADSKINFACPSERILRDINPLGQFPTNYKPGLIEPMIDLKALNSNINKSYIIMFDGKKVRKGGDVDLLGFENGDTLDGKRKVHESDLNIINQAMKCIKEIRRICNALSNTPLDAKQTVFDHMIKCFGVLSKSIRNMRELYKNKSLCLRRLKDQSVKFASKNVSLTYAIDLCRTVIYQIENCISSMLETQRVICKSGAVLNDMGHLFAKGNVVNLTKQTNVQLLKDPNEMRAEMSVSDLPTRFTKQRSNEWFDARQTVKVTGSTIYQAIGCDTLKKQREHFDRVISGVEPKEPPIEQQNAMKHGTDSEIHEIATLSGIILPFMYPHLSFREEGFYIKENILVSPDGSLINDENQQVEFAFEGKAPVGNIFTTPVHYRVPDRYITQTIFEQNVLDAEKGTLYLSWSKESTTVLIVPNNTILCRDVQKQVDDVYHVRVPKRPVSLSKESKLLKNAITFAADNCTYIGEFPSVLGCMDDYEVVPSTVEATYDDLMKSLLEGKKNVANAYNLQRNYASQVVVFLLADLDRLWKPEEPHAVPILYFFRGYSLSMDIAKKILEHCKNACIKKGLDVIASSSDGEFLPLMVKSKDGKPLTIHQLSKSVWSEVCKLQKTEIVKKLREINCEYVLNKTEKGVILTLPDDEKWSVFTPVNGWKSIIKPFDDASNDLCEGIVDEENPEEDTDDALIGHEDAINIALRTNTNVDGTYKSNSDQVHLSPEDLEETISYDVADYLDSSSNDTIQQETSTNTENKNRYVITDADYSDILHILRQKNNKKWININEKAIQKMLETSSAMKKLLKAELVDITQYLNVKMKKDSVVLQVAKCTKVDLINQLSKCVGDASFVEKKARKMCKTPKKLKELAVGVLQKKTYPKQVLNIAYATYLWPQRVQNWRSESRLDESVSIVGIENGEFSPYYVPEFDNERQDFEVFIYDKTHLATNLRKCVCLDKVDKISINAWKTVAKQQPTILNPSVIEVSSEGKILDQMKEKLARTMFSKSVENSMFLSGNFEEARFCNVVREALFVADDAPGISAVQRCEKRLNLIRWLAEGVEFGKFPPYGARIKGMSNILYEGLRCSMEGKLYLYAIAKSGTYCARAPSTLCSESFFSSMQEMDPWGQGILTTTGVEKHISDFTTITAMKMQTDRNIFIKTKRDAAYPIPESFQCQETVDADTYSSECNCRERKQISCIVPKDHFFDSALRARLTKDEENLYKPKPLDQPRGEQPIRAQYGYKINEAKLLPSKRLGIEFD